MGEMNQHTITAERFLREGYVARFYDPTLGRFVQAEKLGWGVDDDGRGYVHVRG